MSNVTTPRLAVIATEIKTKLALVQQHSMEVGELLTEAKSSFEKTTDFLVWAESAVSLKKATVYKYISIWTNFNEDKNVLAKTSLAALYALLGLEEDVKEEVKEIAKAAEAQGKPLTAKEVKEVAAEVAGEEPVKPAKPTIETMTPAQAAKTLQKAEDAVKQTKEKAEKAMAKAAESRDKAIKESRDLVKALEDAKKKIEELESANNLKAKTITTQHETIQALRAELKELQAKPVVQEVVKVETTEETQEMATVGESDDMPWFTEEETETQEVDLEAFASHYADLQAIDARQVANNTTKAAEVANIEVIKEGRKTFFMVGDDKLTGQQLRAMAK